MTDAELTAIHLRNIGNEDVLALIGALRDLRSHMCGLMAAVAKDARADEREACAKVACGDEEEDDWPWCGDRRTIADAIRARGDR